MNGRWSNPTRLPGRLHLCPCSVWSAATGGCTATLTGHKWEVDCVAISPDGKTVVSGDGDNTVWCVVLSLLGAHTCMRACIKQTVNVLRDTHSSHTMPPFRNTPGFCASRVLAAWRCVCWCLLHGAVCVGACCMALCVLVRTAHATVLLAKIQCTPLDTGKLLAKHPQLLPPATYLLVAWSIESHA